MSGQARKIRVLLDMDGVLCDFESHMLEVFRRRYPDEPYVELKERRTLYGSDEYEALKPGLGKKLSDLIAEPNFYLNLPEVDGAVQAVKEMFEDDRLEVFICSSALRMNPWISAAEKYKWVNEHIGEEMMGRVVLTQDKTLISGDILIDDKPHITGCMKEPVWDHILFSQCFNEHITEAEFAGNGIKERLRNWTDGSWRSIVQKYLEK